MKFLADMGISPRSVERLRRLGYEAVHLCDQGLERLPDAAILEKAFREGWILLTHDLEFGELMSASGANLPSVVIFRLRNMKPERVDRYLDELIERHQGVLEEGAIVSVEEGQIRVRSLPIRK